MNKNSKSKQNNNDKLVENLIKEITKEVNITNAKFKKSEDNNYLFYFIAPSKILKTALTLLEVKFGTELKF